MAGSYTGVGHGPGTSGHRSPAAREHARDRVVSSAGDADSRTQRQRCIVKYRDRTKQQTKANQSQNRKTDRNIAVAAYRATDKKHAVADGGQGGRWRAMPGRSVPRRRQVV